ncbi:hypothetical protein HDK77DRAFT_162146 [Phyllosticta capitalensis]
MRVRKRRERRGIGEAEEGIERVRIERFCYEKGTKVVVRSFEVPRIAHPPRGKLIVAAGRRAYVRCRWCLGEDPGTGRICSERPVQREKRSCLRHGLTRLVWRHSRHGWGWDGGIPEQMGRKLWYRAARRQVPGAGRSGLSGGVRWKVRAAQTTAWTSRKTADTREGRWSRNHQQGTRWLASAQATPVGLKKKKWKQNRRTLGLPGCSPTCRS